jgi:hypothetical protein
MGRTSGYFTYKGERRISKHKGKKRPPTNRRPLRSVSVTQRSHAWITSTAREAGVSVREFSDALVLDALRRSGW